MNKIFLDANIFIRFIAKDDPIKAKSSLDLLEKVERGELIVHTIEAIVCEVVYVLSSKKLYSRDREDIYDNLIPIIELNNLKLANKNVVLTALQLYKDTNLDFEDCLLAATAQTENNYQMGKMYSYDKDFDKLGGIERLEP